MMADERERLRYGRKMLDDVRDWRPDPSLWGDGITLTYMPVNHLAGVRGFFVVSHAPSGARVEVPSSVVFDVWTDVDTWPTAQEMERRLVAAVRKALAQIGAGHVLKPGQPE